MKKERVDVLLVKQGLFETREQAKRAVMAGEILGENEERLDKPGEKIDPSVKLHFKGKKMPYVSRGGLKLEKALKVFKLSTKNKTVLDIGSSTGGFTDVALQKGAKLSYALDVGTNQLAWKLRQDPRVVVMENTNFRYSKLEDFTVGRPDFATIDVSFISNDFIPPIKSFEITRMTRTQYFKKCLPALVGCSFIMALTANVIKTVFMIVKFYRVETLLHNYKCIG